MDCVFFGVQLVIDREQDPLKLAPIVRSALRRGNEPKPNDAHRKIHCEVAQAMVTLAAKAQSGYWDFIGEPRRANEEFDDWCEDITLAARLAKRDIANPFRSSAEGAFNVITVAYLLLKGSPSALAAGEACDFEPPQYWQRSTFRRVLGVVPQLAFTDVQGDAAFIMPGEADLGVPEGALREKTFDYLRPLVGE